MLTILNLIALCLFRLYAFVFNFKNTKSKKIDFNVNRPKKQKRVKIFTELFFYWQHFNSIASDSSTMSNCKQEKST